MANNFFDLVKTSFFKPFANGDVRLNYDLLQLINNKLLLDNLQVGKEEIVDWIIEYVDNCPTNLFDDETQDVDSDIRSWAYSKIRYYTNCGWLVEDFEGIKVTYQLDENGIKILSAMENAVKDDTKSLEFSGYVYSIYANLCSSFNYDHAAATIEQVYESARQLNSMLRGLNVNIKKFLTKLISENKAKPREILETIFFDYQKKVVLKAFNNFRGKDNPAKYKIYIENRIDELLSENNLNKMINNYISVKCDNSNSEENRRNAYEFFNTSLLYIKDQFEDIEDYLEMLDRRNTKYITTAQSRLNFLLNEETDIEGRIIECLKGLDNISNDEFFDEAYFDIFTGANIDENSLYKPITKKTRVKAEPIIDEYDDDPEEIARLEKNLFRDNEYSVYAINEFVLSRLKDKNQIHAKDIKINEFKDILFIFLIQLYSANSSVEYKIIQLEEPFVALGYKLNDYIIERKVN